MRPTGISSDGFHIHSELQYGKCRACCDRGLRPLTDGRCDMFRGSYGRASIMTVVATLRARPQLRALRMLCISVRRAALGCELCVCVCATWDRDYLLRGDFSWPSAVQQINGTAPWSVQS